MRIAPRVSVEANARLTSGLAALLLVLLAAEGITLIRLGQLLSWHVFIGMVIVPPVVAKTASTGYRFVRYYRGAAEYRRKGPPPLLLRVLGPVVVVLSWSLLASGIMVLLLHGTWRDRSLFVHKASFVLWFGAMTIHVLGHAVETWRVAPADWRPATRRETPGGRGRLATVLGTVVVGCLLGALLLGPASSYQPHRHDFPASHR